MNVTITDTSKFKNIDDISVDSRGIDITNHISSTNFQGHIMITFNDGTPTFGSRGQHHIADFEQDFGFRLNLSRRGLSN